MNVTKEVAVSGAVGKQVFSSAQPQTLDSVIINAVSATTIAIRDGYASGDTVLTASLVKQGSRQFFLGMKFSKGMHVKIIGANCKCYLVIR